MRVTIFGEALRDPHIKMNISRNKALKFPNRQDIEGVTIRI